MKQRHEVQADEFQKLVPGLDELETMGLGTLEQQEQEYVKKHADELELEAFLAELDDDERAEMYAWPTQGNDAPPAQQIGGEPTSFYPPTLTESGRETFILSKVAKGLNHILHITETIFLSPEPLARIMELRQTDAGIVSRRDQPYDLGVCIPEEIKQTAEHAAAFADMHPFQEFRAPDPLVELGRIVRWLEQLIETGRGEQVRQSREMEMQWCASGCKLIAQCRELCRVMIIRDDWSMHCLWMNQTKRLLETELQQTLLQCEARVEEAKAEIHNAQPHAAALQGNESAAVMAKLEAIVEIIKSMANWVADYKDSDAERQRTFLLRMESLREKDPDTYEMVMFRMQYPKDRGWEVAFAKEKGVTKQTISKRWKVAQKRYPKLHFGKEDPDGIGGGYREAEEEGPEEE